MLIFRIKKSGLGGQPNVAFVIFAQRLERVFFLVKSHYISNLIVSL